MRGKGLQEVPHQHVLFGVFFSGRDQLAELEVVGTRGLAVPRRGSAVLDQNVTVPLDRGEGGWFKTGNLKNVFEDKTDCFAVWDFFCRLLPNLGA